MSWIAARTSNQVLTTESDSDLALIAVLEQMLRVHPTPSNLTVRVVPSRIVILAIHPDR
ncbi:MAG: hypothetical protein LAP40_15315 [Acidobacteriia bacterium]|nr:hypothetical protein [Terriglobia bacterium]